MYELFKAFTGYRFQRDSYFSFWKGNASSIKSYILEMKSKNSNQIVFHEKNVNLMFIKQYSWLLSF